MTGGDPAATCPLCGGANRCAMASSSADASPCWCTQASFGAELLRSVPVESQGKACICAGCAAASATSAAEN